MRDHGLLHRVHADAFEGDDARAIELAEREDARVDRDEFVALGAADQHRARAAITLFADDLRPGRARVVTQPVRQRGVDLTPAHAMLAPIDGEEDVVAHSVSAVLSVYPERSEGSPVAQLRRFASTFARGTTVAAPT